MCTFAWSFTKDCNFNAENVNESRCAHTGCTRSICNDDSNRSAGSTGLEPTTLLVLVQPAFRTSLVRRPGSNHSQACGYTEEPVIAGMYVNEKCTWYVCDSLRNMWFQDTARYCRDMPEISSLSFLQVCVPASFTSSKGSDLEQGLQANADPGTIKPLTVKMHLQSTDVSGSRSGRYEHGISRPSRHQQF
jgi:hypothetical protein